MRVIALGLVLVLSAGPAFCEYSTDDLLTMTLGSLRADWVRDKATARGVGRIVGAGEGLARRGAIVDAQRGLLVLKRSLEEGAPPRPESVTGQVPPVKVVFEAVSGDLYFVEVEASLSELLGRGVFFLPEDEEEDL
ncbi:MAG: hypothetical protein II954_04295 [Synergistaceae bacterium]|nr:hypothetical protein [Synergistaceae bacterium]